jgi:hypothetical protein
MINNLNQMHPTAFACKDNLTFSETLEEKKLEERIKIFLSELAKALKSSGCDLIGHIKGLVDVANKGHFVFSLTSFNEDVDFKGDMVAGIDEAIMTINIIVYGIDRKTIETEYQKTFNKYFR